MTLETHFGWVENAFRILRKEMRKDTVVLYTDYFHPVTEVVLWHEKSALQGSLGADSDCCWVSLQVGRSVPFRIGKHRPIISFGITETSQLNCPVLHKKSICQSNQFPKTSRKPERRASPLHKPEMVGEKKRKNLSTPRNRGQLLNVKNGRRWGEAMEDEASLGKRSDASHLRLFETGICRPR